MASHLIKQAWFSPLANLTALTLKAVFHLALRQTEDLIGSNICALGLVLAVPDRSTLSRRAETLEVPRFRSSSGADRQPAHLLVDNPGSKLCAAGQWLTEKHGTKARRSWRKLHIGVDANIGEIVAAALTTSDVDDVSRVDPLPDRLEGPLASFTGDGAVDQDRLYRVVIDRDPEAFVILPPRATAVQSETAETEPIQRNGHLWFLGGHPADGAMAFPFVSWRPFRRPPGTCFNERSEAIGDRANPRYGTCKKCLAGWLSQRPGGARTGMTWSRCRCIELSSIPSYAGTSSAPRRDAVIASRENRD